MDRIGVTVECHGAVDRLVICAQLRHGIVDLIAGIVIRGNAEGMGPAGSAQFGRIHDGAAAHHRDGNAAPVGGGALPFLRDGDLLLCVFDIGDDIARCGGQLDGRCDDTVASHRLLHGHISDILAILVLGRQLYGGIAPAVPLGQLQRIHRRFRRVVDRRSVLGGAGHHINVNGNRRAVRGRAASGQPALGDGEALLLRIAGVPNDMGGIRGDLRAAHIDLAPLHRDRRLSVAEGRGNEAGRGLGLSQGIAVLLTGGDPRKQVVPIAGAGVRDGLRAGQRKGRAGQKIALAVLLLEVQICIQALDLGDLEVQNRQILRICNQIPLLVDRVALTVREIIRQVSRTIGQAILICACPGVIQLHTIGQGIDKVIFLTILDLVIVDPCACSMLIDRRDIIAERPNQGLAVRTLAGHPVICLSGLLADKADVCPHGIRYFPCFGGNFDERQVDIKALNQLIGIGGQLALIGHRIEPQITIRGPVDAHIGGEELRPRLADIVHPFFRIGIGLALVSRIACEAGIDLGRGTVLIGLTVAQQKHERHRPAQLIVVRLFPEQAVQRAVRKSQRVRHIGPVALRGRVDAIDGVHHAVVILAIRPQRPVQSRHVDPDRSRSGVQVDQFRRSAELGQRHIPMGDHVPIFIFGRRGVLGCKGNGRLLRGIHAGLVLAGGC